MYVISMKQKETEYISDNGWRYLAVDRYNDEVKFILDEKYAEKFFTLENAEKEFKDLEKEILRSVNLSKFDLSTLAIRKRAYNTSKKLQFSSTEQLTDEPFEVGDLVCHEVFSRGEIVRIEGNTAYVEFTTGNGGGTLGFDLNELTRLTNI